MDKIVPTREIAMELLKEYNQNESLIKHALAGRCYEAFCRIVWRRSEKWGIIGLIQI